MSRARALLLLLLCAAAPMVAATASAADDFIEARLWSDATHTRLVLESDAPLDYEAATLGEPRRLFVDITSPDMLPNAVNALDQRGLQRSYITTVRAARNSPGTLRIVFDLSADVRYRIEQFRPIDHYGYRLVIDIMPKKPPADPLLALLDQLERETQTSGSEPFLVLIDPGHGGEDPGAVSPNNRYEKNLVLQISRRLVEEINRRPGMKAFMTRDTDKFIKLYERVHIAHRLEVDAFVSIHADSVKSRKPRGSSVFVLSEKGASSRFARQQAAKANLSDLIGGHVEDPALQPALRQFSQDGKERASYQLAALILEQLGEINALHRKQVESAGFAVLKSPSVPSVLVETAFLSNPVEEKKLLDKNFQQQLAVAIADALDTYRQQYHVGQ